jgi:hypothetical protein
MEFKMKMSRTRGLKNLFTFSITLCFITLLSSCSTTKYHPMQAASPALKGLNTYQWERPVLDEASSKNARQFDARFRAEIERGMATKGYVYTEENAQLLLDYRIAVVSRPGIEEPNYGPHWVRDANGNFRFTNWEDQPGASGILDHGVVTLSLRSAQNQDLLWEGGASKLLESGAEQTNPKSAAKTAAAVLLQRIPQP